MKKKVTLLIISIILVLIILAGTTYSVLFKVDTTEKQSYTTGILDITSNAINNSVTLANGLPISDNEGKTSTPYTFKISNVGNLKYKFDVKLLSTNSDTTTMINPDYIKVMVDNNTPVKLSSLTDGVILSNKKLSPGADLEVTIRMWLDEYTPNTEIGKTFTAKITTTGRAVYSEAVKLDNSGANIPVLADGMIPVVYDSLDKVWRKADLEGDSVTATCSALGDVNGDGSVDVADIIAIKAVLKGISTISNDKMVCADVDGDGEVTSADVDVMNSYSLSTITTFPKGTPLSSVSGTVRSTPFNWYDYDNKKWANAVLVSSTNRSTYQSASAGTKIADADILAFYVWIPRYKYKVWNINKVIGTQSYNAQTTGIDIVFENGTASTGTISCTYSYAAPSSTAGRPNETCTGSNGDYYTHPAFTFGDQELTGFWMGKFELSSSNPATGTSYGGGETTSLTPRILPNVTSWRKNTVSNYWKVIYDMQTSNNIYGLPTSRTNADSHMITNMEWGAVAYLTNSNYGRCTSGSCTEVSINGYGEDTNNTTMTGCGPISSGSTSYSTTCNAYNTTIGQTASTTGNIYGVYDMSGGASEYVMGNMSSASGTSYTYNASSAGVNFTYSTDTVKYLIPYAYGTTNNNQTAYNRGKLGDATSEVVTKVNYGWYNDYASFPYSSNSWFHRGGIFSNGSNAGPFRFNYTSGTSVDYFSGRAALLVLL